MRFVKDPLNLISLAVAVVWIVVGTWFRPIGDFGVETDFYGDFVPFAREWMNGNPSIMLGYRGPFYYLLVGVLSTFGDPFLLAKILSAVCAGTSLRIIGGLLRRLWNPTVAVAGTLFLAANPTLTGYSFRACTDLVYLALFAGTVALIFTADGRHLRAWAAAGTCAGLAYLTRYNGAAMVPVGIVAALALVRPWKRAAETALTFGGAWFVVTSAWLFFLWNQTGDPFWNRNFALIAEEVYGTDPNLANLGQLVDSVGFSTLSEVVKLDPGRFWGVMAGNIPRHFWLDVRQLVGPVWALISAAGWIIALRSVRDRRHLVLAMAGMVAFVSLLPVFYNQRFMLTLVIWWASGFGCAVHFLMVRLGQPVFLNGIPRRVLGTGLYLILVLGAVASTAQGIRRSQGVAGGPSMPLAVLKLAESVREKGITFGPETPIAGRKPHIGYYLGAPVAPMATQGRVNHLAATGMHYLLVSDIESNIYPNLAPMLTLTRPARDFPGYRFLAGARHQEKSGRWQTAALYEVENPAVWHPSNPRSVLLGTDTPPGLNRLDFLRTKLARWYLNWTTEQPVRPLFALMDPDSRQHPLVRETEGDAYLADKKYQEAVDIYEALIAESGDPVDTLLRLSLAHFLAGETGRFESCLNEYADSWKSSEEQTLNDWVNEAAAQCRVRKYVPAAGLLNQVLALDPQSSDPELHRMLGYCYLNFRHPDRARAAFARYLEIVPGDPEILGILKDDSRLTGTRP
jgi:4-amino-4-deoxy-L-arabinose transferase-like glycosyltransferase